MLNFQKYFNTCKSFLKNNFFLPGTFFCLELFLAISWRTFFQPDKKIKILQVLKTFCRAKKRNIMLNFFENFTSVENFLWYNFFLKTCSYSGLDRGGPSGSVYFCLLCQLGGSKQLIWNNCLTTLSAIYFWINDYYWTKSSTNQTDPACAPTSCLVFFCDWRENRFKIGPFCWMTLFWPYLSSHLNHFEMLSNKCNIAIFKHSIRRSVSE